MTRKAGGGEATLLSNSTFRSSLSIGWPSLKFIWEGTSVQSSVKFHFPRPLSLASSEEERWFFSVLIALWYVIQSKDSASCQPKAYSKCQLLGYGSFNDGHLRVSDLSLLIWLGAGPAIGSMVFQAVLMSLKSFWNEPSSTNESGKKDVFNSGPKPGELLTGLGPGSSLYSHFIL